MNLDHLTNSRESWRTSLNVDCDDIDHENIEINSSDNQNMRFNTIPKREKRLRFNTYKEFSSYELKYAQIPALPNGQLYQSYDCQYLFVPQIHINFVNDFPNSWS